MSKKTYPEIPIVSPISKRKKKTTVSPIISPVSKPKSKTSNEIYQFTSPVMNKLRKAKTNLLSVPVPELNIQGTKTKYTPAMFQGEDKDNRVGRSVNNAIFKAIQSLGNFDTEVFNGKIRPKMITIDGIQKPLWYIGDKDRNFNNNDLIRMGASKDDALKREHGLMTIRYMTFHDPNIITKCTTSEAVPFLLGEMAKESTSSSTAIRREVANVDMYRGAIFSYKLRWDNRSKLCTFAEVKMLYDPNPIHYQHMGFVDELCIGKTFGAPIDGTIIKVFKFENSIRISTATYIDCEQNPQDISVDYTRLYYELGGPSFDQLFPSSNVEDTSKHIHIFKIVHPSTSHVGKVETISFLEYIRSERWNVDTSVDSPLYYQLSTIEVIPMRDVLVFGAARKSPCRLHVDDYMQKGMSYMDNNIVEFQLYYLFADELGNLDPNRIRDYVRHNSEGKIPLLFLLPTNPLIQNSDSMPIFDKNRLEDVVNNLMDILQPFSKRMRDNFVGATSRGRYNLSFPSYLIINPNNLGQPDNKDDDAFYKLIGLYYEKDVVVRGPTQNGLLSYFDLILGTYVDTDQLLSLTTTSYDKLNDTTMHATANVYRFYGGFPLTYKANFNISAMVNKGKLSYNYIKNLRIESDYAKELLSSVSPSRTPAMHTYITMGRECMRKMVNVMRNAKELELNDRFIGADVAKLFGMLNGIGINASINDDEVMIVSRQYDLNTLINRKITLYDSELEDIIAKPNYDTIVRSALGTAVMDDLEKYLDNGKRVGTMKIFYSDLVTFIHEFNKFEEYIKIMKDQLMDPGSIGGTRYVIDGATIYYTEDDLLPEDIMVSFLSNKASEYSRDKNYVDAWKYLSKVVTVEQKDLHDQIINRLNTEGKEYRNNNRGLRQIVAFFLGVPL